MAQKTVTIPIELDISGARKDFEKLEQEAKSLGEIKIPIQLDLEKNRKQISQITEDIRKIGEKKISINIDIKDAKKELKELDKTADGFKDRKFKIEADIKQAEKAITGLNAETSKLKDQKFAVRADVKTSVSDLKKISKEIGDIDREAKTLKVKIDTTQAKKDLEELKESSLGLGDLLSGGAIAGAVAGVVAGFAQLGEATEAVRKLQLQITGLTGVTGSELDSFTAKVTSVADTFGLDAEAISIAASNVAKNTGGTFGEAVDFIAELSAKGVNATDELLPSLTEFSTFAESAGLSLRELGGIIEAGIDFGAFANKAPDAIKELTLRINEGADATKDALANAFGDEFTNNFFARIDDGSLSVKEGIVELNEQIQNTSLSTSQLAILTADLGGGPVEDLGGVVKAFDLITTGIANANKELTESEQRILNQQKAAEKFNQIIVPILSALSDVFIDISIGVQEFTAELFDRLLPVFQTIGDLFNELGEALSGLFDNFNDGTEESISLVDVFSGAIQIVTGIVGLLVKAITFVVQALDSFDEKTGAITAVADAIKKVVTDIFDFTNAVLEFFNLIDTKEEKQAKDRKKRAEEAKKLAKESLKIAEETGKETDKLTEKVKVNTKAVSGNTKAQDERNKALEESSKATDKLVDSSQNLIDALNQDIAEAEIKVNLAADKSTITDLEKELEGLENAQIPFEIDIDNISADALQETADKIGMAEILISQNLEAQAKIREQIISNENTLRLKQIGLAFAKNIEAETKATKIRIEEIETQIKKVEDIEGISNEERLNQTKELTDKKIELEELLVEKTEQIAENANKDLLDANQERNDAIFDSDKELAEEQEQLLKDSIEQQNEIKDQQAELDKARAVDLDDFLVSLGIDFLDDETDRDETSKEQTERLTLAKQDSYAFMYGQINDLARGNAELEKVLAIGGSIISTAKGVATALSTANIPLSIAIGILGAIQVAKIISTPIGGAFTGMSDVTSENVAKSSPSGSDSHLMMLASHERVVTADTNMKHYGLFEAVEAGLDPLEYLQGQQEYEKNIFSNFTNVANISHDPALVNEVRGLRIDNRALQNTVKEQTETMELLHNRKIVENKRFVFIDETSEGITIDKSKL